MFATEIVLNGGRNELKWIYEG